MIESQIAYMCRSWFSCQDTSTSDTEIKKNYRQNVVNSESNRSCTYLAGRIYMRGRHLIFSHDNSIHKTLLWTRFANICQPNTRKYVHIYTCVFNAHKHFFALILYFCCCVGQLLPARLDFYLVSIR